MKNIEKIIYENKETFNSHEPSDGHFERFETLLNNQRRNQIFFRKSNIFKILKIAAIITFVMISSLWVYEHTIRKEINSRLALHDVSNEYKEVEFYYTSQINNKYEQIKNVDFNNSNQKSMLLNELTEMDSIYKSLQQDMKLNPNDERVINAMIKYYRTKTSVMNHILNQLKTMSAYNKEDNTNNVNI
ncbi:MAG: hypothetical protein PF487_04060 [Bacteroidales bacterium]|jgi:hypothetical protein|nr:hypothetical protein [Bacteroidales bacterium]